MRLTAFSWGYWGWGPHTSDLIRSVDGVERARGKEPPIFADIRFFRSGRATGFRGSAFEETVGNSRYRWFRKLGNQNIGTGDNGVRIADPVSVGLGRRHPPTKKGARYPQRFASHRIVRSGQTQLKRAADQRQAPTSLVTRWNLPQAPK
jgi:hypothetical protein